VIRADWPECFPANVHVAVSSTSDGTVLDKAVGIHNPSIVTNRTRFCEAIGMSYGDVVYQRIVYSDDQTYDIIKHVTEQDTSSHVSEIQADGLIIDTPGVGLMLPVADCVATVIYDVHQKRLALLHLGRHSTLANLMQKAIAELCRLGGAPHDMIIWMAPSVHKTHYKLDYFTHRDDPAWQDFYRQESDGIYLDMHGYNRQAAIAAGVMPDNIHISPINTATSPDYFSHSYGDTTGRFAVVAVLSR
jgi:copper oxidase (laccase) domain-containing protein